MVCWRKLTSSRCSATPRSLSSSSPAAASSLSSAALGITLSLYIYTHVHMCHSYAGVLCEFIFEWLNFESCFGHANVVDMVWGRSLSHSSFSLLFVTSSSPFRNWCSLRWVSNERSTRFTDQFFLDSQKLGSALWTSVQDLGFPFLFSLSIFSLLSLCVREQFKVQEILIQC